MLAYLHGLLRLRTACHVLLKRRLLSISPNKEVHVMLVLTRKAREKVIIDGGIAVEIVALDGNKVRLGITAPPHVRVDREEVYRARREFEDSGELVAAS
jgi:carbon storage regulator